MKGIQHAQEVCSPCDFDGREIVRHNWARIGLEYWFTDYNHEYWREAEGVDRRRHCILVIE